MSNHFVSFVFCIDWRRRDSAVLKGTDDRRVRRSAWTGCRSRVRVIVDAAICRREIAFRVTTDEVPAVLLCVVNVTAV
jgi:hypothetical protein